DIYMAHDGNKTFPYSNSKYYNKEKFAYYADGKDGKYKNVANHAVTIVGWDDNFSKDNFITKPNIDGAWIVKDAQGETFGDKGYFYVSYATVSMTEQPYVFNKIAKTDEFDGIYQKDLLPFTGYLPYNFLSDEKTVIFNKFNDNKIGDILTKIGFATTKPNAE
ncbi:C1 family peptidase, partial [Mesomycoplasma ovipneumoniae]|uniref:C1 family peptidase n=1 Tax=Mesomycoplasma ovipneumoniae TaxID=29562 RepID=UPI00308089EF